MHAHAAALAEADDPLSLGHAVLTCDLIFSQLWDQLNDDDKRASGVAQRSNHAGSLRYCAASV
jgi:hypothetical protein